MLMKHINVVDPYMLILYICARTHTYTHSFFFAVGEPSKKNTFSQFFIHWPLEPLSLPEALSPSLYQKH